MSIMLFTFTYADTVEEIEDVVYDWDVNFNQEEYQKKVIKELFTSNHSWTVLNWIKKNFWNKSLEEILDEIENDEVKKNLFLESIEKKLNEVKFEESLKKVQEEIIKVKEEKKEQEYLEQLKISWKRSLILNEYVFNENISNWFAKWWCTWFTATQAFKFEEWSSTKQISPWLWNANQWLWNAKNAWYQTWKEPKNWSIITFSWYWYSHMWHVWIVREVLNNVIIIEDMKAKWKLFLATKRVIQKSDPAIEWFIYL